MPPWWQWRCIECEGLAREFQDAWRSDQQEIRARFQETKAASDEPETFLRQWVMSLARMSDDEFDSFQSARCPRVAEVRRKWREHATVSGHAGLGDGWRAAFIFDAVLHNGYGGFLRGSQEADK